MILDDTCSVWHHFSVHLLHGRPVGCSHGMTWHDMASAMDSWVTRCASCKRGRMRKRLRDFVDVSAHCRREDVKMSNMDQRDQRSERAQIQVEPEVVISYDLQTYISLYIYMNMNMYHDLDHLESFSDIVASFASHFAKDSR